MSRRVATSWGKISVAIVLTRAFMAVVTPADCACGVAAATNNTNPDT
jgi:hypothetical protein